jgi:hypothetical protein
MANRIILGVQVTNRLKNVADVQKVLSEYGCNIKTRLGLHDVNENYCSTTGLLLMETYGDAKSILEMERKLRAIDGLVIQKMTFEM